MLAQIIKIRRHPASMTVEFSKNYRRMVILLIIIAGLGFTFVLSFTRFGLGTTGDSVHYIMGAQNLLVGKGYSRISGADEIRPITMAPPFYSIVMSILGLIGGDILEGVRILQAFLFSANIFLVGIIIFRYTRSVWASLFGAVIMLMTSNLIVHHGFVLTEALFIFLLLVVIYCVASYFDTNKRYLVILSGFLISLTTLTRYVGASLIAASLAAIFIFGKVKWRQRLIDCLMLFIAWLAPVSLWFVRNLTIGSTIVNREIGFHPMAVELIRAYRAEISFWFVPAQLGFPHWLRKTIMTLLAIVGPVIFFLLELRDRLLKIKSRDDPFWIVPWFLVLHMVFYASFLYLTLTFTDAVTDFDVVSRYLIPVYVSAVILYPIIFHRLIWQGLTWQIPRVTFIAIGICLVFLYAQQSITVLRDPIPRIGYTGFREQEPSTTTQLSSIDNSTLIISNKPELFYVLTNRPAYMLPIKYDFVTGKARDDFDQQVEATRRRLNLGSMIVVFIPMYDWEKEVINLLGVKRIAEYPRCRFYGYPEAID
jgi:hypothetical protein